MIEVSDGKAHRTLSVAKAVDCRTGSPAGIGEMSFAIVDVIEIRSGIVGLINILVAVVVEVREHHGKAVSWYFAYDSGGLAHVRKRAVTVIAVKQSLLAVVLFRLAGNRNSLHLARTVRVRSGAIRLVAEINEVRHVQI